MTFIKRSFLFFVIALSVQSLLAQKSVRDSSISMGFLNLAYSLGQPGGDLADRFGLTNVLGGEIGYKLDNGWYAYTGLKFVFGNVIKEPVARNVVQIIGSDSSGYQTMALGADGRYYTVRFFERGYAIPLVVGKIFRLGKSEHNLNSGLYLEAGAQFLQHKIQINAIGDNVPNLSKPFLKGYDRLTNGIGLVEGIGYRYFGSNRFLNFFAGAEFSQNFTRNRRDLNYDTGIHDTANRMDLLYNLKVGWVFPIYRSAPESEYYY